MVASFLAGVRRAAPAPAVLNPPLFEAMLRHFNGRVRVANPGVLVDGYYVDDRRAAARRGDQPDPGGPPEKPPRKLVVVRWGEAYVASCPFCRDTRDRLSVSHRYGEFDPETGWFGRELWRCYNEDCQHSRDHRAALARALAVGDWWKGPAPKVPRVTPVQPGELPPAHFPGVLVPVDRLPADHAVAAYVRSRGFDPAELAAVWGVAFAEHVPARVRGAMCQGRLIVPVTADGVTVGWQARYPDELDWKTAGVPKYLTFYPKSRALYGADQLARVAADDPAVVALVEGCTDAWRYGPGALSGFGKGLSVDQARLAAKALARLTDRLGRPPTVVLVPDYDDPDSEPEFFRAADRLREAGFDGPVGVCPLPAGTDPAALSREKLRGRVAYAAATATM